MRTTPTIAVAAAIAALIGPGCGSSSPTAPPPPAPTCTFQIAASSQSFGPTGGFATLTVTTGAGCAWSASANESWVTLAAPASGSGPGNVAIAVAENTGASARQCAVSLAGQSIAISQAARPTTVCTFTLVPASERFGADGGARTFAVETAASCEWAAVSDAAWVAVTSGSNNAGPGSVGYTVARWTGAQERTGRIRVGQAEFVLRQDPPMTEACSYAVTPVEFSPCMPARTLSAAITTQQGCTWTAAAGASWLALMTGASNSGSGVVEFRVAENYDAPRDGIVELRWPSATAGQNLQVRQAGCIYAVSTGNIDVSAAGGAGSFDVLQQSLPNTCGGPLQNACVWTAQADVPWISLTTAMPQAGDNPVRFTVSPNGSGSARTGFITVRDKTVRITQAGS